MVAALSARVLAEAAARDGFRVIALDRFGDADTRRAAAQWHGIGCAAAMALDRRRLLGALADLAAATADAPIGWVPGSDLEGEPAWLAAGAQHLPLLGTAPADVQRVRDPHCFFKALDALGLPHPPTCFERPADPRGWLRKLARGSGGWHIRAADALPPGHADAGSDDADRIPYYQRAAPGTPMSLLFVGNGTAAAPVGINRLLVRPLGHRPHVFRGAIGPVPVPPMQHADLVAMASALTAAFALRGLASLDVLHDGQRWSLLEINPRPSASMALYADLPLMRWHVDACLHGRLPQPQRPAGDPAGPTGVETVFARSAVRLGQAAADRLAARADCHDLPAAGASFAPGDPVCSVSAQGASADAVAAALAAKRQALRDALDKPDADRPAPAASSRSAVAAGSRTAGHPTPSH